MARYVQGARDASLFLVVARHGSEILNVLVPSTVERISAADHQGLDLTRRFAEVRLRGPRGSGIRRRTGRLGRGRAWPGLGHRAARRRVGGGGRPPLRFDRRLHEEASAVRSTIGSFQALKHRMADMLVEVEGMRAATYYAALALGDGLDDAAEAVATAGAYVFDTFAHLCGEALQLHGGIGFTWEHDVHLFVRRAKVNQVLYGDGAWHRERLVRLLEQAASEGRA